MQVVWQVHHSAAASYDHGDTASYDRLLCRCCNDRFYTSDCARSSDSTCCSSFCSSGSSSYCWHHSPSVITSSDCNTFIYSISCAFCDSSFHHTEVHLQQLPHLYLHLLQDKQQMQRTFVLQGLPNCLSYLDLTSDPSTIYSVHRIVFRWLVFLLLEIEVFCFQRKAD